jgi:hypothetical protein
VLLYASKEIRLEIKITKGKLDREGPKGCEMSRFPYFLDSRLTNGGEVVGPCEPAALYPQEDSWYSFLLQAESIPEP